MDNSNSKHGEQQPYTLTGLKSQYRKLLLPLQERFWSHELTCTPAMSGRRYEDNDFRLMYVGRAVNGWEADWKESSIDDLVEQVFSYNFQMASIAENPNQNGYNFNRSGFFQLCKQIMKREGEEDNWSDKILWSNLYKVAPFEKNNPGNKLISETIDQCIEILDYELNYYKPSHVVFVTNDWWFDPSDTYKASFSEKLNITVKHNTKDIIIGNGTYNTDSCNTKIVVTKRPEGLEGITREKHAKLICDAFASLD